MEIADGNGDLVPCELFALTAPVRRLDGTFTLDGSWRLDGQPVLGGTADWAQIEDVLEWDGATWKPVYQLDTGMDAYLSTDYSLLYLETGAGTNLSGNPALGFRVIKEHPIGAEVPIQVAAFFAGSGMQFQLDPLGYEPSDILFLEYNSGIGTVVKGTVPLQSFKRRISSVLATYDGSRTYDGTWMFDGKSTASGYVYMYPQSISIDKTGQKLIIQFTDNIDPLENAFPTSWFSYTLQRHDGSPLYNSGTLVGAPYVWLAPNKLEINLSSHGLVTPIDSRDVLEVVYNKPSEAPGIISISNKLLGNFGNSAADIRNKYFDITSDATDVDINALFQARAGRAITSDDKVTIDIASGVTIGASAPTRPALGNAQTPIAINVKVINSGNLLGAGGLGAGFSVYSYNGEQVGSIVAGRDGGSAIADLPPGLIAPGTVPGIMEIINNGTMRAGGGGGGAVIEYTSVDTSWMGYPNVTVNRVATGGGGAGNVVGPGGVLSGEAATSTTILGSAGSALTGGAGNNPMGALLGDGGAPGMPGEYNDLPSKNTSVYLYTLAAPGNAGVAINVATHTLVNNGTIVG